MLCVVRVNGRPKLVPACATIVDEGMSVESEVESVIEARRVAIELLLSDHLGDCIAPCHGTCPAGINIPAMLRQIALGNMRQALMIAKESVALPATLGYICPELCEKGCRRKFKDESVSICLLKRFVAEEDLKSETPYLPQCKPASGKKVAIIGAGPAGLSAAYYLIQKGHACHLFDENKQAGGLLRYGALEKQVPHSVLDAEIAIIEKMGAVFHFGARVNSFDNLRRDYDAVLVAVGGLRDKTPPDPSLEKTPQGIKADKATMLSNIKGVFVAGSAAVSAIHAVRTVADGRNAADRIDDYFHGPIRDKKHREFSVHVGRLDEQGIQPFVTLVSNEHRIEPGPQGFTPEQAKREALRCIQCGCVHPHSCRLRQYATQYEANPTMYKGGKRGYERENSHPEVIFESGKCIACGICVRIASEHSEELGLSFVGRGFAVRTTVPFNESLREGLRVAARACAEACPTGALTLREWYDEMPERHDS
jgi:ferredoxin